MKVAIYQMDILPGDPVGNRKKVAAWAKETTEAEKADVLVLPEMWTTAYTLTTLANCADENEETLQFLQQLAKQYHVNIIGGSIATKEEEKIYNRALVINRAGECIYQYDKIHLVPMLKEHLFLEGGRTGVETFELDGVKMGLIICYDLRFPELARSLALDGAEVLFVLAEWPEARAAHWVALQQARAIENQLYVVSSNRVGSYDDVLFAGRSMVINPWGTVISEGSQENEETLVTSIKQSEVTEARTNVPVFSSRVPSLYKRV